MSVSSTFGEQDGTGNVCMEDTVANVPGSDLDLELDLEQLVMLEGSSWANDEVADTEGTELVDEIEFDKQESGKKTWSMVVGRKERKLSHARSVTKHAQNSCSDRNTHDQCVDQSGEVLGPGIPCPSSQNGAVDSQQGRTLTGDLDNQDNPVRFPDLSGQESQHKLLVEPVFLAYNRVSRGAQRVTLLQIACAIVDALNDSAVVDAVQPMKSGW